MIYCLDCKPYWVPATQAGRYFGKCQICDRQKLCMGLPEDEAEALQAAFRGVGQGQGNRTRKQLYGRK